MKKHTIILISIIVAITYISTTCMTSCKKKSNSSPDSATFLFHLHTQIVDSTIGGNTDGYDSNTTGSANPWYLDAQGRYIELFVPQFFVTGVQLVNANGSIYNITNAVVLKGLDSEDYYLGKAPVGTYLSANFTVGLINTDSITPPSTLFITDGILYPVESGMWSGTDYYGMKITGAYDTTAAHTGINPLPFTFNIPNGLTIQHQVSLPARGTAAANNYPVYVATAGSINYVHVLCDYGKLLGNINLRASNQTSANSLIADTLANNLINMFRYEE